MTKTKRTIISYLAIIALISISNCYAQNNFKSIEVSTFAGTNLSFSHLTGLKSKSFSSPPHFGLLGGLKIETTTNNKHHLSATLSYFSQDLSIASRFFIQGNRFSIQHTSTKSFTCNIFSLGLKKSIQIKPKHSWYTELGGRLHFIQANRSENHINYSPIDSTINFDLNYLSNRQTALIPYIALGYTFSHKWFKLDLQIWGQSGFNPLVTYETLIEQNNFIYTSNVISRGQAVGLQLAIRLISF